MPLPPPTLPTGITSLPANVTKLKQLECLDLSGCRLAFLPSQLWRLSALRRLRLNGTSLMVGLSPVPGLTRAFDG